MNPGRATELICLPDIRTARITRHPARYKYTASLRGNGTGVEIRGSPQDVTVSQEMKQNRAREQADAEARKQAAEKRKQELHKWKVLRAEADVDHRLLQNLSLNLQNPEYRLSVGAERIIAAQKAA